MSDIIIFEGVDHCGKTTIAKALSEYMETYPYFKVKQERLIVEKVDQDILKEAHLLQMNFFYELARQANFRVIMDRFYPSEYVYGSLFRKIDEAKIWEFDKLFASLNTKIIIVQKQDEKLEDELWTKDQLIAVKNKFHEFAEKTACKVLIIDTDDENLEQQISTIANFIYDINYHGEK